MTTERATSGIADKSSIVLCWGIAICVFSSNLSYRLCPVMLCLQNGLKLQFHVDAETVVLLVTPSTYININIYNFTMP